MEPITGRNDIRHLNLRVAAGGMKKLSAKEPKDNVEEEGRKFMRKVCKVLMLVENLPVPADPRVWAEATTLRDAGFQISIICPKGPVKHQEAYICIDRIYIYRYQLPASSNKFTSYFAEFGTALLKTFWLSWKVLLRHGF